MKRLAIFFIHCSLLISGATAQDSWTEWGPNGKEQAGVIVRAGYTIGGTTPMPLPNEVRRIVGFSPKGGATVGMDVYKMLSKRWGIAIGTHLFYEGFHTCADVKNYGMSLTQEGNTMSGYFTGRDVTDTDMWGITLPVLATFRISPRWNVSLGPYFSAYFKKSFSGEVYDNKEGIGYLRVDTPTGEKVNMTSENPATYDFEDEMDNWNVGVEVTFDWKAMKHMNVFAMLDWGLTSVFPSNFEALQFRMYPIYGTLGVAYRY